jgi:hypothetical protein
MNFWHLDRFDMHEVLRFKKARVVLEKTVSPRGKVLAHVEQPLHLKKVGSNFSDFRKPKSSIVENIIAILNGFMENIIAILNGTYFLIISPFRKPKSCNMENIIAILDGTNLVQKSAT